KDIDGRRARSELRAPRRPSWHRSRWCSRSRWARIRSARGIARTHDDILRMLIIDQNTVERLLPMPACIELMRDTLAALARGDAVLPLRTVLKIPDGAFAVMPAYLGTPPTIGAKIITVFPRNHGTAFDSHQGAVLLFDSDNGSLVAVMDATSVTTIRTAAVSGVATQVLARDDASSLAILGAGVQGHSHLEAMCAVRSIKTLHVWSRSSEHARRLADVGRERFQLDSHVM